MQTNNEHTQRNAAEEKHTGKVGGKVTLTADEQAKVQKTLLSTRDVPRVEHPTFRVEVGTTVPRELRTAAVPPVLFEINPEWRGYDYCVVEDEIVIIDRSRHIVALLPVGSSIASSADTRSDLGDIDIRTVQEDLIELGFYHGPVDGRLGFETRQALIRFQEREGLAASGHIDVRTFRVLETSRRSASGSRLEKKETRGEANGGPASGDGAKPRELHHVGGNDKAANFARKQSPAAEGKVSEQRSGTVGQSARSQDQSAKPGNAVGSSESRRKHTY